MLHFALIAVKVGKDCYPNIKKVLNPDWYLFNTLYKVNKKEDKLILNKQYPFILNDNQPRETNFCDEFWGENIFIQAIVGKNGSGKSSILEIIFRMVNNLSVKLLKNIRPDNISEELHMVRGIDAELYFIIHDKLCCLKCKNEEVLIDLGNGFKPYGKQLDVEPRCENSIGEIGITHEDIYTILHDFFYTIVCNYSLHSYNLNDYIEESVDKDIASKPSIWLGSLFHKNDGYLTPIVLNPYRDDGILNVNNELNLTNSRLAALLILYDQNKNEENNQFIEGYDLGFIKAVYDENYINKKYSSNKSRGSYQKDLFLVDTTIQYSLFTCIKTYIQIEYQIHEPSEVANIEYVNAAYKYLAYKILSISNKYPSYLDDVKYDIQDLNTLNFDSDGIDKLITRIHTDTSHITLKVRQTVRYIKYLCEGGNPEINRIEDYIGYLKSNFTPDEITELLPPPFYQLQIYLQNSHGEQMPFNKLSSGERQFIFSSTTILYHIRNILSIPEADVNNRRIPYKHINLVLDEIELCFHPEYQRTFIYNLLNFIKRLGLNKKCAFNIILATHSPFILSDIPDCNILYLKDGQQVNQMITVNSFGANIHDLLRHSFFLENGSTGEFAKQIIQQIINRIQILRESHKTLSTSEYQKWNAIIRQIGEPLIRTKLSMMIDEVYCPDNAERLNNEIFMLRAELHRKEQELTNIKDTK